MMTSYSYRLILFFLALALIFMKIDKVRAAPTICFGDYTLDNCTSDCQLFASGCSAPNCVSQCFSYAGGVTLPSCTEECTCSSADCEMPNCTKNCTAMALGTNISSCTENCYCTGGSCDMSNCVSGCNCGKSDTCAGVSGCGDGWLGEAACRGDLDIGGGTGDSWKNFGDGSGGKCDIPQGYSDCTSNCGISATECNAPNCTSFCVSIAYKASLPACMENCECHVQGCDMPLCTKNCLAHSTETDMRSCTENCECKEGKCDMRSCEGSTCVCGLDGTCGPRDADADAQSMFKALIGALVPLVVIAGIGIVIYLNMKRNRQQGQQVPTQEEENAKPTFPVNTGTV